MNTNNIARHKYKSIVTLLFLIVYFASCTTTDGYYTADVQYYNPNTGTRSNYTLKVEVKDNRLVTIYFPNGGWMDNDHFDPPVLDSSGKASFINDRRYHYKVQIRKKWKEH